MTINKQRILAPSVGVGRGLVGIFGTHQPLARPLFLLPQGGWLNSVSVPYCPTRSGGRGAPPRSRTRKRPAPMPPSWGLPPPHPRYKCVTINQARMSLRGGAPHRGGARFRFGAPKRSRSPVGRPLSGSCYARPSPFGGSSPLRPLASPLRAPTPLQKRCLVVLRTTKIIHRLPLTDAP